MTSTDRLTDRRWNANDATRVRLALALVGVVIPMAACGGSGTESTESTVATSSPAVTAAPVTASTAPTTSPTTSGGTVAGTSTTIPSPPETATTPPVDTSPETAVDDLRSDRRVVSSVLADTPEAGGWRLPAGSWQSTAFEPGLAFDLSTDLLLVDQSPEAIELAPADGGAAARLSILVPNAVGGNEGIAVATPNDPIGYLEALDDQGAIDLDRAELYRAPDGTDGFIADFAAFALARIGLEEFDTYRCDRGFECIYIMHTAAGPDIQAIEGESIRIVGRTIDERPYRVVARGPAGPDFDRLAAEATAVANSLELLGTVPPAPDTRLLAMVGTRAAEIPAGDYVTRLGESATVEISVTPEVGPIALGFAGQESIRLQLDGVGAVSLAAPLWVDPAAGQSAERPSEDDMLPAPIETLAAYRAWLGEFADVEEVGRLEVSGRDAVSLDGPLRQGGPTWPCADEPGLEGDRCVWLRAVDNWWWYGNDVPTASGGDYFVDGTGLVLTIEPDDQTADVTDAVQRLLDAITIRLPAGTG